MREFSAPLQTVRHCTKAVFYPDPNGGLRLARIQTFSDPRFMEDGWEPRDEKSPRPCIRDAEKLEKNGNQEDLKRAVRRARREAFDLIMCNPELDCFATFTYAPEAVADKADYEECYRALRGFLTNAVQRSGLRYIIAPEYTKAGDIHFHAICNADGLKLTPALSPHTGRPILHHGDPVYNVENWGKGFSTAQKIRRREDRDDTTLAVAKYIFKYMGKNLDGGKIGGRYLLKGGRFRKPMFVLGDSPKEFLPPDLVVEEGKNHYILEGDGFRYEEYDLL